MPIKDCVRKGDKLYCWNNETNQIDIYTRKSMPVEKCPHEILSELMHLLGQKLEEVNKQ